INRMIALKEAGTAILLLTHDLALAEHLADWIGVIRAGRLVEIAPPEDLTLLPQHPYTELLLNCRPDLHGGTFTHPRGAGTLPPPGRAYLRLPPPEPAPNSDRRAADGSSEPA
ncbi:MAG: hypothetical protein AAGI70_15860, partial [Pseudomonadota bacterium]